MQAIFVNMGSPKFEYELSLVIGLFFRDYEIATSEYGAYEGILSVLTKPDDSVEVTLEYLDLIPNRVVYSECVLSDSEPYFKQRVKRSVYKALSQVRESISPWGTLVGIRPVKIVHECMDQGMDEKAIFDLMESLYLVKPKKIQLLLEVATKERPYLYPVDQKSVSLYLSIPFCPTRCVYCSFPSNPIKQKSKWVDPYVDHLIKEMEYAVNNVYRSGRLIDCVYIGGGTPSSLSEVQLDRLLGAMNKTIRFDEVKEYTVEAGRPDTITLEKLLVFKKYGVDRICVNPQSMQDKTLKTIGRSHSSEDIHKTMDLVRQVGFKTVNMDLIVGLTGEGMEDIAYTLSEVMKWRPENITLHTLALKRAADLTRAAVKEMLDFDQQVSAMMQLADEHVRQFEYEPYYMYRQKKMIGHLENVGYAFKGHESLYNMRIIEERHTILALGAGATSKICFPDENRHERIANFKGVEEYIHRFDEILKKKDVF